MSFKAKGGVWEAPGPLIEGANLPSCLSGAFAKPLVAPAGRCRLGRGLRGGKERKKKNFLVPKNSLVPKAGILGSLGLEETFKIKLDV